MRGSFLSITKSSNLKEKEQTLFALLFIPEIGVEPIRPQRTLDPKSSASANSATPAKLFNCYPPLLDERR